MVQLVNRGRQRSLFYSVLIGLGAGVLVSCAANQPPPPPQTPAIRLLPASPELPTIANAAPRPAHKPTPPLPAGGPTQAPGEETYATTEPKPIEGATGPETSSPSSDLAEISSSPGRPGHIPSQADLIGLDEPAATHLFGPATENSDEPPATVWRYKTASCELDLYFYFDLRSGRMRTLHYAFRGEGADTARRQECLRSVLASRGG